MKRKPRVTSGLHECMHNTHRHTHRDKHKDIHIYRHTDIHTHTHTNNTTTLLRHNVYPSSHGIYLSKEIVAFSLPLILFIFLSLSEPLFFP